jgi:hypothetical protein
VEVEDAGFQQVIISLFNVRATAELHKSAYYISSNEMLEMVITF